MGSNNNHVTESCCVFSDSIFVGLWPGTTWYASNGWTTWYASDGWTTWYASDGTTFWAFTTKYGCSSCKKYLVEKQCFQFFQRQDKVFSFRSKSHSKYGHAC